MGKNKRLIFVTGLCILLLLPLSGKAAEKFPTKAIELDVPFAAGGSTDVLARLVAKFAPKHFDKPLVVVNKPGGGGVTGTEGVVRSKPDGYTLYVGYGSGHDLVMPHFVGTAQLPKMPYDTFKDLLPVCRLSVHSIAMVIRADAPYKTLKEFIEWGKKKEQVTASVSTKAGSVDITFQALGQATGLKIVTIPFRGGVGCPYSDRGRSDRLRGQPSFRDDQPDQGKTSYPDRRGPGTERPGHSRCSHL